MAPTGGVSGVRRNANSTAALSGIADPANVVDGQRQPGPYSEEDPMIKQARTNLRRLSMGVFDPEEDEKTRIREMYERFPRPDAAYFASIKVPVPPWKDPFNKGREVDSSSKSFYGDENINNAISHAALPEGISFSSEPDFDYEEPVDFGKSEDEDGNEDGALGSATNENEPADYGGLDDYAYAQEFSNACIIGGPHEMSIAATVSRDTPQGKINENAPRAEQNHAEEIKYLQTEKATLSNMICDLMDLADDDESAASRLKELRSKRRVIDAQLNALTGKDNAMSSSLSIPSVFQDNPKASDHSSSSSLPSAFIIPQQPRNSIGNSVTTNADQSATPGSASNQSNLITPGSAGSSFFGDSLSPVHKDRIVPVTPLRSMHISNEHTEELSEWSGFKFPWSTKVKDILGTVFKLSSFRKNQLEAINAVLSGKDVFVLMPTGGGKSLCYQLPAVFSTGVTFVVSPLISLIQDQLNNLHAKNIPALTISSGLTEKQRREALSELNSPSPECKLFYITPEMLMRSQAFQEILSRLVSREMVARFVIDEAHCLSQWGHDFRPDYKELKMLKSTYPRIPIMALTATANSRVKTDIIQNLGIANCIRLAQSFNRLNLRYYVLRKTKSIELEIVSFINSHYHGKSGIIYCLSKKDCELMAHNLQVRYHINAKYYHANLNPKDRARVQRDWAENRVQVIVATIAFGMGIDKPDVRFVIHHSIPKSLEGYYQETGRAGRDGLDSTCVLYYSYGDKSTHDFLIDRGEGSLQQKQQQRDSLREVVQFCENRIDCRRQMVLQYFGETFDAALCNKTCDNCENRSDVTLVDRSNEARAVLSLLNDMGPGEKITLVQLIDVFRGSGSKRYAKFTRNPNFGTGRDLTRTEAERLLQNMVAQNILQQFNVSNAMGYVSTYVKAGLDARDVERGVKRVVLTVDNSILPEIPVKSDKHPAIQRTLPTRNKALSKRKKRRTNSESEEESEEEGRKDISCFVINSDPVYDPDDDPQDEEPPNVSARRKTKQQDKPVSSGPRKGRQTKQQKEDGNPKSLDCYNAVLKKREEICVRDKLSVTHVMDNKTIKEISLAMPTTLTELAKIRGIDDNKLVKYGPDIISLVKKFT